MADGSEIVTLNQFKAWTKTQSGGGAAPRLS